MLSTQPIHPLTFQFKTDWAGFDLVFFVLLHQAPSTPTASSALT